MGFSYRLGITRNDGPIQNTAVSRFLSRSSIKGSTAKYINSDYKRWFEICLYEMQVQNNTNLPYLEQRDVK